MHDPVVTHTNADPITHEPGSHPVGTGTGAAGGAVTGAAIGLAVGGPVGFAIGGTIGAMAGAAVGSSVAEELNPTTESAYWQNHYLSRPYVARDLGYAHYEPAYRYGWESRARLSGRSWDDVQNDLSAEWLNARGSSSMEWDGARHAVRDAWDRGRVDSLGG